MMIPAADRRAIPFYLLFTWTASCLFYFLIIRSAGTKAAGGAYTQALMWCPAVGAFLTCRVLGRPLASLGWQWGETRYQVLSYLIPLAYATVTYATAWWTGIAAVNPQQSADAYTAFFGLGPISRGFGITLHFLMVATIGVIENCATTLGEEIGWRGFLVPALAQRYSFTATAVLSGFIWAAWHVPIIVFAGYNAGTGGYGLAVVFANMIGLCFVLTWLRLKSGSLWTAVILHASSNHFIQHFFDPMTEYTGRAKYILGEFGIGFTLAVALLAVYFWRRRAEVAQPQLAAARG
ncbi:CPBP family intramembrane glutamic endopeptidase [Paludibaculum fermentans]|uniref:CPBP family intramembrane glutamic endopeptidase n=1 Tax=Paludibaculum fermentans TaxID=1473598 RepID=UPI003EBBA9FA